MTRKLTTIFAAAALAVGSTAAPAAAPLSLAQSPEARASAPMDGANDLRREVVAVALGILLLVLVVAVMIHEGDEPVSP